MIKFILLIFIGAVITSIAVVFGIMAIFLLFGGNLFGSAVSCLISLGSLWYLEPILDVVSNWVDL